MGKKGKRGDKPSEKKAVLKRLDALAKKLEEELKGADLFAPLPPTEDCPICFVPLSRLRWNSVYYPCCGNSICMACDYEHTMSDVARATGKERADCAFCRQPDASGQEHVSRLLARAVQKNDAEAYRKLGSSYISGSHGLPIDEIKGIEYCIRSIELGSARACCDIAKCFDKGSGIPADKKKSAFFLRVGALRGDILSRHIIGLFEYDNSKNYELGIRHLKVAAEAGAQCSLDRLKRTYNKDLPGKEFISKSYLDKVYRDCHTAQEKVKSEMRDKHGMAKQDGSTFKC